jgi:hypothetical protein
MGRRFTQINADEFFEKAANINFIFFCNPENLRSSASNKINERIG